MQLGFYEQNLSEDPNQNFVNDWYVALDVIFQDFKERLCYFRSTLPMTQIGCVIAGEKFWIIQSRFKSRLFGLHLFFAFFRKKIFDKSTVTISCT